MISGFDCQGLRLLIWDLGFRVQDFGVRVCGLGCRARLFNPRVLCFRVEGSRRFQLDRFEGRRYVPAPGDYVFGLRFQDAGFRA